MAQDQNENPDDGQNRDGIVPQSRAEEAAMGKSRLKHIADLARTFGVQAILFILAAAVVIFLVAPGRGVQPEEEDVATLWINSIKRLGIEPVFPPQEDFYVGDVYAVIDAYDEPQGDTRERQPNAPLLRKSVRVGHINLRGLSQRRITLPRFPKTSVVEGVAQRFNQPHDEENSLTDHSDRVDVSLVSFPAFTISRHDAISGSNASWLPFRGQRSRRIEEKITIGLGESYGAETSAAVVVFDQWCDSERTRLYCTDAVIRKILGYTVDPRVLETRDGKYVYRIDIKLVTRVYMMRELDFSRIDNGSVSASLGEQQRSAPDVANSDGRDTADAEKEAQADVSSAALGMNRRSGLTLGAGSETFPRPMVFGFKAVTFSLDPSEPEIADY